MTNAQGGMRLASEIMGSIAVAYDWPDFSPFVRTAIKVDRPFSHATWAGMK
jgi:hypothetical protein